MYTIKFEQEKCPKCKVLDQMTKALKVEVDEVVLIDNDNRDYIKEKYDISSTPTVIAFDRDGIEVERLTEVSFGKVNNFFQKL